MFYDRCASYAPSGSSTIVACTLPLIFVFLMFIIFYSCLSYCDAFYTFIQFLFTIYDRCALTHHLSAAQLSSSISGCMIFFPKEPNQEICQFVYSGSEIVTFLHLRTALHISKIFPEHLALEVLAILCLG